MALVKSAALAASILLLGALLLFRDSIPFLQSYDGKILKAYEARLVHGATGELHERPSLEIDTGTEVLLVEVSAETLVRARAGMRARKRPFSLRVQLFP
jgi:hypothetical protein